MTTAPPLTLSDEQRRALERMARSTSLAVRQVTQAKALLWASEGVANEEIARRCAVDADTVRRWHRRFADNGVEGVGAIAKGRGRKSWLPEGTVAEVVRATLEDSPDDTSTHWTTRTLADRFGIGKDTVARIWRNHHLKPWKVDTFKRSNDPTSRGSWWTWSGCTWTRPSGLLCAASTKRPSARRWTARSQACPCVPVGRGR